MSSGGGSILSQASGALGDIMSDVTGASGTARAMQAGAMETLGQQRQDRAQALSYASSPEEMAQLQNAISQNQYDIARKQKLLDSVDPALLEAGHQALALMQGKDASSLAPMRNQIANQRQQLQTKLAKQLGPDYETSSAGMAALNQFDQNAANALNGAQQDSLKTFLGSAQNTQSNASLQNNIGNIGSFAQQYGARANRQVGALQGTQINASLSQTGAIAQANAGQANVGQAIGFAKEGGLSSAYKSASSTLGGFFGGGAAAPAADPYETYMTRDR